MNKKSYDKTLLRFGALFFALIAIFGWDWSAPNRTKVVDEWEPILSFALLAFSAAAPTSLTSNRKVKPLLYGLLAIDILIFFWWLIERGTFLNGQIDIGGIVIRLVATGIAFALLLPRRESE